MIFDFDDYCDEYERLDLLGDLKRANPLFRCTLFTIPERCTPGLLAETPDWCEIVPHGWTHPDPYECSAWTYERMWELIEAIRHRQAYVLDPGEPGERWKSGFKAPGWQISDVCYAALREAGWWVADHYENDARRPHGLRTHRLSETASCGGDPGHWHGHCQDVCGNGLEETFPALLERVRAAESFELVSEAVQPWQ